MHVWKKSSSMFRLAVLAAALVCVVGLSVAGEVKVGKPTVEGASVKAEVIGEHKGKKLVIFRFKRRKNIRRKTGHRQTYTRVRITEISA